VGEGGLLKLPGGDGLAYGYCGIADSGVDLLRFDPRGGQERWRTSCAELGVSHSKYRHEARARVSGHRLLVVSVGSSGKFAELIDPETGGKIHRREDGGWRVHGPWSWLGF